ncbi:MAG TPA: cysteine desulfurase NifS [Tepidanaerobacter syntrophicus]|uniref:cysteine desulfurase NifS n=1 Tax=Tepidanaerobacter syntrophicus TaxID=224999 RepID=UPI00176B26C0|nr:cysteine desulfurase NifS [Tepidanaerobacter syntrophicus]HHV84145.1 cysteine desulfurase NifS [Tepidanaerobacter syntrophicus]
MKRIYLDNAATTPVRSEVLEAMLPYFTQKFGNASTIYSYGREAKEALEESRKNVAQLIGANAEEIFFTSGGTESDNWALRGIASANVKKGKHIITSSVEHHAVLHTCQDLEKQGFKITYLPVDKDGLINVKDVADTITDETILVSIMHANNEIGTIQPINEIAKAIKQKNPEIIFHTDAVQTAGKIPVNVNNLGVDLLSMSAHKIYGPKGVGALYIRKGTRIAPFMTGGAQESSRRAGTENIAGIVGFGKAAELAVCEQQDQFEKLTLLRDRLMQGILNTIPYTRLNGHPTLRLPHNVNISFEFIEGESILLNLDMKGICASSGSACTSGSLDPSHVLLAIGLPHEIAHGSLRLTLGRENSQEDVDYVLEVLPGIIDKLRNMSPLFAKRKEQPKDV